MKKLLLLSLILSYGLHAMDNKETKLVKLQKQEIDDTVASGPYQYPTDVDNILAKKYMSKKEIQNQKIDDIVASGPYQCPTFMDEIQWEKVSLAIIHVIEKIGPLGPNSPIKIEFNY